MREQGYRVAFATNEPGRWWLDDSEIPFMSTGQLPFTVNELRTRFNSASKSSFFGSSIDLFADIYLPSALPFYENLITRVERKRPDLMVIDINTYGAYTFIRLLFKEKKYANQEAQKWWINKSLNEFKKILLKFNIEIQIFKVSSYKDFFEKKLLNKENY